MGIDIRVSDKLGFARVRRGEISRNGLHHVFHACVEMSQKRKVAKGRFFE